MGRKGEWRYVAMHSTCKEDHLASNKANAGNLVCQCLGAASALTKMKPIFHALEASQTTFRKGGAGEGEGRRREDAFSAAQLPTAARCSLLSKRASVTAMSGGSCVTILSMWAYMQ